MKFKYLNYFIAKYFNKGFAINSFGIYFEKNFNLSAIFIIEIITFFSNQNYCVKTFVITFHSSSAEVSIPKSRIFHLGRKDSAEGL